MGTTSIAASRDAFPFSVRIPTMSDVAPRHDSPLAKESPSSASRRSPRRKPNAIRSRVRRCGRPPRRPAPHCGSTPATSMRRRNCGARVRRADDEQHAAQQGSAEGHLRPAGAGGEGSAEEGRPEMTADRMSPGDRVHPERRARPQARAHVRRRRLGRAAHRDRARRRSRLSMRQALPRHLPRPLHRQGAAVARGPAGGAACARRRHPAQLHARLLGAAELADREYQQGELGQRLPRPHPTRSSATTSSATASTRARRRRFASQRGLRRLEGTEPETKQIAASMRNGQQCEDLLGLDTSRCRRRRRRSS